MAALRPCTARRGAGLATIFASARGKVRARQDPLWPVPRVAGNRILQAQPACRATAKMIDSSKERVMGFRLNGSSFTDRAAELGRSGRRLLYTVIVGIGPWPSKDTW